MDELDRRLVEALRADARASYAQLARLVGLSSPSVQERVRRLERRGVITGYHAAVDPRAVGLPVTALVGVHQTDSAELADVAERLATIEEVEDCFFVAGDNAFVVKVRVSDIPALESTIGSFQRVEGVARTRTTVVLSTKWEHRQVPLPSPSGPGAPATAEQDPAEQKPAEQDPAEQAPAEQAPGEQEAAEQAPGERGHDEQGPGEQGFDENGPDEEQA